MPSDLAQSKALKGSLPQARILRKFRGIANDEGPPRRPDPMLTRCTTLRVAAFPVAAFGAASTPLALSLDATAADASALALLTDIYSAYNGKEGGATRSTTNAPSGALSSRRSQH